MSISITRRTGCPLRPRNPCTSIRDHSQSVFVFSVGFVVLNAHRLQSSEKSFDVSVELNESSWRRRGEERVLAFQVHCIGNKTP